MSGAACQQRVEAPGGLRAGENLGSHVAQAVDARIVPGERGHGRLALPTADVVLGAGELAR